MDLTQKERSAFGNGLGEMMGINFTSETVIVRLKADCSLLSEAGKHDCIEVNYSQENITEAIPPIVKIQSLLL